MPNTILEGKGKNIHRVSDRPWREHLAKARNIMAPRLAFMTPEHHPGQKSTREFIAQSKSK